MDLRNIKTRVLSNKFFVSSFIKFVNTPFFGDIYDIIYLKYIKLKTPSNPLLIAIEPSNICNLKCIMCPYKRMKRPITIMSMSLFKKIVDQTKELNCKEIHLAQYNEPLADPYIFERIDYIHSKGIRCSFYSNGSLLSEDKCEKLLNSAPELIRFSIDGINKNTYESIRVGANYDKVVSEIQYLFEQRNKRGQKYPIIETYFTVLNTNKNEVSPFLKFWKNKCDYASITIADSRESKDYVIFDYSKLKPYPCFSPRRVYILSNGKVVLCCADIDGGVVLGDLKKEKLKDIINSKKFQSMFQLQLNRKCNVSLCKNCSKLYLDSAFMRWSY